MICVWVHVQQVWISYAQFEAKADIVAARGVFRRGYDHLRQQGLKEERWEYIADFSYYMLQSLPQTEKRGIRYQTAQVVTSAHRK